MGRLAAVFWDREYLFKQQASIHDVIDVLVSGKQPGPLTADKVAYIAPGTDFGDIVGQLKAESVIDNPLIFHFAVMASGKRSKIKAREPITYLRKLREARLTCNL
ncbi:MAG TPA: hypothetical protein VL492_07815 [Methylovirgula sp.]|nr:hypothetical protein [Methylovirgula sp.]